MVPQDAWITSVFFEIGAPGAAVGEVRYLPRLGVSDDGVVHYGPEETDEIPTVAAYQALEARMKGQYARKA